MQVMPWKMLLVHQESLADIIPFARHPRMPGILPKESCQVGKTYTWTYKTMGTFMQGMHLYKSLTI